MVELECPFCKFKHHEPIRDLLRFTGFIHDGDEEDLVCAKCNKAFAVKITFDYSFKVLEKPHDNAAKLP